MSGRSWSGQEGGRGGDAGVEAMVRGCGEDDLRPRAIDVGPDYFTKVTALGKRMLCLKLGCKAAGSDMRI